MARGAGGAGHLRARFCAVPRLAEPWRRPGTGEVERAGQPLVLRVLVEGAWLQPSRRSVRGRVLRAERDRVCDRARLRLQVPGRGALSCLRPAVPPRKLLIYAARS